MSEPMESIPATGYIMLGMLSIMGEELAVVDIKARADYTVGRFYWSPAVSHIRRELTRLRDLDLVREREIPVSRLRRTLVYQITEAGEDVLRRWIESLPEDEPVVLKHPVILRMWLGARADPKRLVEILDHHMERTRAQLDELTSGKHVARRAGYSGGALNYPLAVTEYLLRYYHAELANISQLRGDLAEFAYEDDETT